jgi:hypothetical protein
VVFDLLLAELFAYLVQRLHGLGALVSRMQQRYYNLAIPFAGPAAPLWRPSSPAARAARGRTLDRRRGRQSCPAPRSMPSILRPHPRPTLCPTVSIVSFLSLARLFVAMSVKGTHRPRRVSTPRASARGPGRGQSSRGGGWHSGAAGRHRARASVMSVCAKDKAGTKCVWPTLSSSMRTAMG